MRHAAVTLGHVMALWTVINMIVSQMSEQDRYRLNDGWQWFELGSQWCKAISPLPGGDPLRYARMLGCTKALGAVRRGFVGAAFNRLGLLPGLTPALTNDIAHGKGLLSVVYVEHFK